MRSEKAEATLTLLTRMRALLDLAGYDPWSITWGPWWESDYYAP